MRQECGIMQKQGDMQASRMNRCQNTAVVESIRAGESARAPRSCRLVINRGDVLFLIPDRVCDCEDAAADSARSEMVQDDVRGHGQDGHVI